jgi:hypothetical protein
VIHQVPTDGPEVLDEEIPCSPELRAGPIPESIRSCGDRGTAAITISGARNIVGSVDECFDPDRPLAVEDPRCASRAADTRRFGVPSPDQVTDRGADTVAVLDVERFRSDAVIGQAFLSSLGELQRSTRVGDAEVNSGAWSGSCADGDRPVAPWNSLEKSWSVSLPSEVGAPARKTTCRCRKRAPVVSPPWYRGW